MLRPVCFPVAWSSWYLQVDCLHKKCWIIYYICLVITMHSCLWASLAGRTARYAKRLVYHAVAHRITPKRQAKKILPKPATSLRSSICGGSLVLPSCWLVSVSFLCRPSVIHQLDKFIGLTVAADSNLVPSGLGLRPERMLVFLHSCFCFLSFFPCLLCLLDTILLSSYEVPGAVRHFWSNVTLL